MNPRDPMNDLCSLTSEQISGLILLIVQYKYLRSCSKDFMLQDLILRTRLWGTSFIPQLCWVVDFHLINIVLYQPDTWSQRANWRGWPLNIYTWFIGSVGSHIWTSPFPWHSCICVTYIYMCTHIMECHTYKQMSHMCDIHLYIH